MKGSDFWHSFVRLHPRQRISFLKGSMDKAVAVTLVVYYHFSSLRVVLHLRKDAQGTCECSTVSPSSQLCCVYLYLSLNHMMNRRPPPSLVVIGWLVRETLTSCILSKHNTTILKQSMHTSVCSTISMHIFKGALHIFYTLKSVSAMRSTIQPERTIRKSNPDDVIRGYFFLS